MQNPNKPLDTSFVHAFNWSTPELLQKALDVVGCAMDHHEDGKCPITSEEYHIVNTLLASNPNTPSVVLEHLSAHNKHPQVLERIASNSSAGGETLKRLSQSEHSDVRRAVAEHPALDGDTLKSLAKDPHTDVRFSLAENHHVPSQILQELANDDNPYVAHRALVTYNRVNQTGPAQILPTWTSSTSTRQAV